MKKILLLFLVFLIIIFILLFLFFGKKEEINNRFSTPTPTIDTTVSNTNWPYHIEIPFDNQTLAVYYIEIPKSAKLSLIPNFSDKENGETIVDKYNCDYAVNGGFYQENSTPLGLFFTNGQKYGEIITSNIATGFFWQDKNNNRALGKNPPPINSLDLIFQAGPLIIPGNYQLKMVSDEKARRILMASDKQNRLYLMSVFDKENNFSGPNLSDLPAIFASSTVQQMISVAAILNLDGGAASFFYAKENNNFFSLLELTPIGNLICIKKNN